MIACGKIEEVEVIPPYKIVVVRTCILKFLHSDPPVGAIHEILHFASMVHPDH